MRSRVVVLFVAAFLSLATCPAALAGKFNKTRNIGDAAPSWSDLPGIDGKPHGLADLKEEKGVVVCFFSHDCHVSQAYAERIAEQLATWRERGIAVVLIDCVNRGAEALEGAAEFARAKQLDCSYLQDERQKLAQDYGATHTPAFFVLDGDRKIFYMGAFDDDPRDATKVRHRYVVEALDALLAKEKPRAAETRLRGCPIEFRAIAAGEAQVGDAAASDPAAITPFQVAVPPELFPDLRERLARTRWPDAIGGWEYGVDPTYMKELAAYWRESYSAETYSKRLNQFDQFTTEIDGLSIHFIHQRSEEPQALPLVLVHGWPGSVYEFHKVIGPLVDPVAHGGQSMDAFHVICPSLPGFGFSEKPDEPGWNSQRMAEVIAKLMQRLGYDRYGAQGGDWGSGMALWMASNDGGHCVGAHSNFPSGGQPKDDPLRDVTPAEQERVQKRAQQLRDHYGYAAIQGSRPLTIGYALADSPTGLAAWVIDKFWAWTDHGGNLESRFTKDELLTNLTIYWATESAPSAARIYFESSHPAPRPKSMTPFTASGPPAPVGFALFPKEINVPPRAWVERSLGRPIAHWTEMPRGGHFAALETPELLVEDVSTFFRRLRN